MARAILDTIDNLPELLKAEYVLVGEGHPLAGRFKGRYALKVDPVDGVSMEDVIGLKQSVSELRVKRDELTGIVSAFGDMRPEDAKNAVAKLKEMQDWTPEQKVQEQIEAAKAQVQSKASAREQELLRTLVSRDSEVDSYLVDSSAVSAIARHQGESKLLLPIVKSNCRVVRDPDGRARVVVLQADGKTPRITNKQGSTDNMGIEEFIESLKADDAYARAFDGTKTKGTGTGKPPSGNSNYRGTGMEDQDTRDGPRPSAMDRLRDAREQGTVE